MSAEHWAVTAGVALVFGLLVALAIAVARRERLPQCSTPQAAEVRSMTRECVIHTRDGVDWCYGKAQEFAGCTP